MADFGAFFRADDGSLLVTSDTPCYELFGEFAPISRSGNVNTYSVQCFAFPLIVVNCGAGGKAGVLAVEGGAGNWVVSVLTNVSCTILAFIPITGNATSGYGLAAYDASGRLVFDSFRKILNARHINSLYEGASFPSVAGVNAVAYTSGPVKPSKTVSEQWVNVEAHAYNDMQYQCSYQMQYNCYQELVYVCNMVYVCTPSFSCSVDPFTGWFSCGYVDSCGYQQRCGYETQTVCRYENVQVCAWVSILNYARIDALVRTTNWSIERGVASITSSGSVSFEWMLHKSGYYKQVIDYATFSYSQPLGSGNLPIGYNPPIWFLNSNETFEGELTKNNSFPYTSDRANTGALACITTVRSDYD
jgi:hypothetical protein